MCHLLCQWSCLMCVSHGFTVGLIAVLPDVTVTVLSVPPSGLMSPTLAPTAAPALAPALAPAPVQGDLLESGFDALGSLSAPAPPVPAAVAAAPIVPATLEPVSTTPAPSGGFDASSKWMVICWKRFIFHLCLVLVICLLVMSCELLENFKKWFWLYLHSSSAWRTLFCSGSLKPSYRNLVIASCWELDFCMNDTLTFAAFTVLLIPLTAQLLTTAASLAMILPLLSRFSCTYHTFTNAVLFSTSCSPHPSLQSVFSSSCLIFFFDSFFLRHNFSLYFPLSRHTLLPLYWLIACFF